MHACEVRRQGQLYFVSRVFTPADTPDGSSFPLLACILISRAGEQYKYLQEALNSSTRRADVKLLLED